MKRTFFIVTAILLGFFSACKENEESTRKVYSIKEGRVDVTEDEFVTMHVFPEDVFVNSPIKLIIENYSKGGLLYGQAYSLEYFDNGNWTEIQLDINFETVGYVLNEAETVEEQFYVPEVYFQRLGKYRIVKSFSLYPNFPFEIDRMFDLYAEFEIK